MRRRNVVSSEKKKWDGKIKIGWKKRMEGVKGETFLGKKFIICSWGGWRKERRYLRRGKIVSSKPEIKGTMKGTFVWLKKIRQNKIE